MDSGGQKLETARPIVLTTKERLDFGFKNDSISFENDSSSHPADTPSEFRLDFFANL
jgi:hypothetical protein